MFTRPEQRTSHQLDKAAADFVIYVYIYKEKHHLTVWDMLNLNNPQYRTQIKA